MKADCMYVARYRARDLCSRPAQALNADFRHVLVVRPLASMSSQFVNFNVSGTRFTTFKETVLREPASRLALLVREVLPVQKDEQGAIFIDRDAKYFQLVSHEHDQGGVGCQGSQQQQQPAAAVLSTRHRASLFSNRHRWGNANSWNRQ